MKCWKMCWKNEMGWKQWSQKGRWMKCTATLCILNSMKSKNDLWLPCGACEDWFHKHRVGLTDETEDSF